AVGPARIDNGTTRLLYHFDGTRWRQCDPGGIEGVLSADSACASLAPLLAKGLAFRALARVPLENGKDDSKANDFEAVALASVGGQPTMLRFRAGQWSLDDDWTRQLKQSTSLSVGGE